MQRVTTFMSHQTPETSGASEPCLLGLKQDHIPLLLKILALFQEIANCLVSHEQEQSSCATYRYLHANSLIISYRISIIQQTKSSDGINALAKLVLNQFASVLQARVGPALPEQQPPFSELVELYEDWGRVKWEAKFKFLQSRLRLNSKNCWEALVVCLENCFGSLGVPSSPTIETSCVRARSERYPPSDVYFAASAMFQALTKSSVCNCEPCHAYAARLKLATHRKPPDVGGKFAFEFLLNTNEPYWQEAIIHTMLPQKKASMRNVTKNTPLKRRGSTHRIPVHQLCKHIRSSSILSCLNLGVEDGTLWKFQSSDDRLRVGSAHISLEKIIKQHPTSFSEKSKRVLCVLVGHSFLHLHDTIWLRPNYFNSSQIFFFGTKTLLPLKPFIHIKIDHGTPLNEDNGSFDESDEFIDPDDLPLHSHPSLVMLAIMLIELYMVKPVSSLVQSSELECSTLQTLDENSRYRIAIEAFRCCESEFTDNYRLAIATCLDPNIGYDMDNNKLEQEEFKNLVYKEIIQRLEEELDQGFGESIPINNLDEAAPTMNLNRWGTTDFTLLDHTDLLRDKEACHRDHGVALRSCSTGSIIWGHPITRFGIVTDKTMTDSGINNPGPSSKFTQEDYTVGWICALSEEMAAARAMLDQEHPKLLQNSSFDNNSYVLGRLGAHNIVLACLPHGVPGTTSAAVVANQMRSTFKCLKFGLMVGIGGAAPSKTDDIRLGDVVVGVPDKGTSIVQYDFGQTVAKGKLVLTSSLNRPPDVLLTAVSNLRSKHILLGHKLRVYLEKMVEQYPRLKSIFSYPGSQHDVLYESNYIHRGENQTCMSCDSSEAVPRRARDSADPVIHYGIIASGNQVMKDAITRDCLKRGLNILCFEMEAAGLVDDFPCLVIRGISDYADSHKNDSWRYYAAATAAAYARELLDCI